MFSISPYVIDQILLPSFLRFLLVGGGFSLLVGIGLIFQSELMFRIFEKMNLWVSTRRATRVLEIPRDSWPFVLRYRYILSVFITSGAVYAAVRLITQVDMEVAVPDISSSLHLPRLFVSWLLNGVELFLIFGSILGIAVGLMLGFSLSTTSKMESLSGTWISTRTSAPFKKANAMHTEFDRLIMSFPKTAGCIVTITSMVMVSLVWAQVH